MGKTVGVIKLKQSESFEELLENLLEELLSTVERGLETDSLLVSTGLNLRGKRMFSECCFPGGCK